MRQSSRSAGWHALGLLPSGSMNETAGLGSAERPPVNPVWKPEKKWTVRGQLQPRS